MNVFKKEKDSKFIDLNKYDIVILGAGLSSATLVSKLDSKFKILVIEKRKHIGGNVFDYEKNGILVHKYGPHIFHTNDETVMQHINKYTKLNDFKNIVNAKIGDNLIPLPVNKASFAILFPNEYNDFIKYLNNKFNNKQQLSILELSSLDKFQHIYTTIYNRVFACYTSKMWGKNIDEIDKSVFDRVPVYLNDHEGYFTDKYQGLPKNGYTNFIKKMFKKDNVDIITNCDIINTISIKNQQIYWKNEILKPTLISCSPIDEFFNYEYGELPYRSLNIEFEELNTSKFQNTAVVNYPEHPKMTRITEYKNFYPELNNTNNTIISKEYPGEYDKNSTLFNVPYYPMPTDNDRKLFEKYLNKANAIKNFYLLGRLATYKYINMDQAIFIALDLANKINKKY